MRHIRQISAFVCVLGASLPLTGCGLDPFADAPSEPTAQETVIKRFAGAVVGDEPRAVVEARGALAQGGNAADAAVAMFFTLAAASPSSASLGSGGTCVVFEAESGKAEALEFIAGVPAAIPGSADRPSAVPGSPMGFWALHARYGKLAWSQLVTPGERLAQFGVSASRTLISDLTPVVAPLLQDPESRRVFADATGRPIAEGDTFVQPELARVLSAIRLGGAVELYRGSLARDLAAAAKAAGGSLDASDLAAYRAEWRPAVALKIGFRTAYFAPPPAAAGAVEAQMLAMLAGGVGFDGGSADRLHALAEAGMRAYADRARWLRNDNSSSDSAAALVSSAAVGRLTRGFDRTRHTAPASLSPVPTVRPENPAATSFAIVDRTGMAVSCTLTMNNSFGTGRMARGMGILLAAVPNAQGRGPLSLGPMIATNESSKQFFFAAGASGGVVAPTALMNVAARVLLADQPLESAMKAPRVHHGGAPDITYHEPEVPRDDVLQLSSRGHTVAATPTLGLVNAISCFDGMPRNANTCTAASDPRGHGIALSISE